MSYQAGIERALSILREMELEILTERRKLLPHDYNYDHLEVNNEPDICFKMALEAQTLARARARIGQELT